MIELPRTAGCIGCGEQNPHGLHLRLEVDPEGGEVRTTFVPGVAHIGFDNVIHGGVLATAVDEVMVWTATWKAKRFCLCAEMTMRFRYPVAVGQRLEISAEVEFSRPKLVETAAKVFDGAGVLIATASGKYMPMSREQHQAVMGTFVEEAATARAAGILRG